MILYALWMFRVWYRQFDEGGAPLPWFFFTFLGVGVFFCIITCSGHIAAETANGHCLSCYMVFVFLLVMLEAAITTDVFMNRNWEEDFPEDPTGKFNEFKNFVRSNFDICKWIGLGIVAAQGMSIVLAMVLRGLGPDHGSYYDSDDDYVPTRLPLLRNQVQHTQHVMEPHLSPKKDSWNSRIHNKMATHLS